ncbi:MAG: SPOR domain-containing protein [Ignavibacteriaceae bacterium]|jgi:cell division septation protein DedD
MYKIFFLLISFSFFFLIGCSSSNEETKNENGIQKEEYVFDASDVDSTTPPVAVQTDVPKTESTKKFIVQIGAFTTKDHADEYAADAKKKLSREVVVSYSDEFKLYVVQLLPFATKAEAESVKKRLWVSKDYKDAFIVVLP